MWKWSEVCPNTSPSLKPIWKPSGSEQSEMIYKGCSEPDGFHIGSEQSEMIYKGWLKAVKRSQSWAED